MHGHNVDMDLNAPNARKEAWSSYWAGGALHSCVDSYGGNYAGAIGGFWRNCFGTLPPNTRVLDLATGNGPLPLLLWEQASAGKEVIVDAVDLALVSPPWHDPVQHVGLRFHSGVQMETLPFADVVFDLVISQFGLEYARWPDALLDAIRVMKPSGRAAFVLHHSDSVLARVARSETHNHAFLLAENGLLEAARCVIPWISRARQGAIDAASAAPAAACRQRYNLAMRQVAEQIEVSPVPDVLLEARAWVHGLLSGAETTDQTRQLSMLAEYREAMEGANLRTTELLGHALDAEGIEGMAEVFRRQLPAHDILYQALSQEEGILGWGLVATPAGSSPA